MKNPDYFFDRLRDVLDDYESSRELALVKTKIDEAELWLTKCKPTKEALERDRSN